MKKTSPNDFGRKTSGLDKNKKDDFASRCLSPHHLFDRITGQGVEEHG